MRKFLLFFLLVTVTSTVFAQLTVLARYNNNPDNPVAPWIYAWDSNSIYSGSWPGVQLTDGPDAYGYYTFTFPAGVDLATSNIVFSNANGNQTLDIPISKEGLVIIIDYYDFTYEISGIPMCAPGLKCLNSLASVNSIIDLVIDNKVVKIVGASTVKIINISGVTVQSSVVDGLEFVSQPLNSGMYIIVADGKATKVIIK